MIEHKRNFFSFIASLLVHILILGLLLLGFNSIATNHKIKIISLKMLKISKVKKKFTSKSTKPKPKPKPKPKSKSKPISQNTPDLKPAKKFTQHLEKDIFTTSKEDNITNKSTTPLTSHIKKPATTSTVNDKSKYIHTNLSKIISAINEAKFYPKKARILHIEGLVKVEFLLRKDKTIKIVSIQTNKRFLKNATIKIIKNASKEFPKPPENINISVPIEFQLRN